MFIFNINKYDLIIIFYFFVKYIIFPKLFKNIKEGYFIIIGLHIDKSYNLILYFALFFVFIFILYKYEKSVIM